jgi:fatty acid CoA ligase FadD9
MSLDEVVDWVIEAGYPIQRIDDYDDWLARFETGLRALPDKQRRRSALRLLEGFKPPALPLRGFPLPSGGFRDSVRAARIGPDHDVPRLTQALINKYLTDLQHLELI